MPDDFYTCSDNNQGEEITFEKLLKLKKQFDKEFQAPAFEDLTFKWSSTPSFKPELPDPSYFTPRFGGIRAINPDFSLTRMAMLAVVDEPIDTFSGLTPHQRAVILFRKLQIPLIRGRVMHMIRTCQAIARSKADWDRTWEGIVAKDLARVVDQNINNKIIGGK